MKDRSMKHFTLINESRIHGVGKVKDLNLILQSCMSMVRPLTTTYWFGEINLISNFEFGKGCVVVRVLDRTFSKFEKRIFLF